MSEETAGFNPLREASHNADGHRKRYYTMVGDVFEFSDHKTFSKAHGDFAKYLAARKYEDDKGSVHDVNGRFVSREGNLDGHYDTTLAGTDQFAGKSLGELAHMVADARSRNDATGQSDAEDAFYEQFADRIERGSLGNDNPEEGDSTRASKEGDIIDRRLDYYSNIMYGDSEVLQDSTGENTSQSGEATGEQATGNQGAAESGAEQQNTENISGSTEGNSEQRRDSEDGITKDVIDAPDEVAEGGTEGTTEDSDAALEDLTDDEKFIRGVLDKVPGYAEKMPEEQRSMRELIETLIAIGAIKNPEGETDADNGSAEGEEEEKNDPDAERISDIINQCDAYMKENHTEDLEKLDQARQHYLELAAKAEKGYSFGTKPFGFVDNLLRGPLGRLGGNKLANWLDAPRGELKKASDEYQAAMTEIDKHRSNFLGHEVDNGNMSREELRAQRALAFSEGFKRDTNEIVDMQKEKSPKPLSKILRRVGYVVGAVAGGAVAMTPFGLIGGMLVAGGTTIGLRGWANSRNANTKLKEGVSAADEVAKEYIDRFDRTVNNLSNEQSDNLGSADFMKAHNENIAIEKAKNRNRIFFPLVGTLALTWLTKTGLDTVFAGSNTDHPIGSKHRESIAPKKPVDGGGGNYTQINTNGAPERDLRHILDQVGGTHDKNMAMDQVFKQVYDVTGGKVFVDSSGQAVPMKDFGGHLGLGYTQWNLNEKVRLSDSAIAFLKGQGFRV